MTAPIGEAPAAPLARVRRGNLVESVHHGHLLVTRGEDVVLRAGQDVEFYPRSAAKPFQALAMLRAGVELSDEQLALACASHAGLHRHRRVALQILTDAGLSEADLQNTPDLPLDAEAAAEVRAAGGRARPLTQNCSGKHAAMLATCRQAGWDVADYLASDHPLQRHILRTFAEVTGTEPATSVDGCGAPTPTTTLTGLTRALRALLAAPAGAPEARIARVMRAHPDLISGPGLLDTEAMAAVPGLLVKGGAEGVLVAALDGPGRPSIATVVIKIADGHPRALPVLLAQALSSLGVEDPGSWPWAHVPVLGHGREVGQIESALGMVSGR